MWPQWERISLHQYKHLLCCTVPLPNPKDFFSFILYKCGSAPNGGTSHTYVLPPTLIGIRPALIVVSVMITNSMLPFPMIQVPQSHAQAMEIDKENRNDFWKEAEEAELHQIDKNMTHSWPWSKSTSRMQEDSVPHGVWCETYSQTKEPAGRQWELDPCTFFKRLFQCGLIAGAMYDHFHCRTQWTGIMVYRYRKCIPQSQDQGTNIYYCWG